MDFSSDLVFAHFALAITVSTKVLHVDLLLLKNHAVSLNRDLVDKTGKTKRVTLQGLAGLIVTDAALVVYGMVTDQSYLNNPRLQVKFTCVVMPMASGYLVHLLECHAKE